MTTADFTRIAGGLRQRAAAALRPSRPLPDPTTRAWVFDAVLATVLTVMALAAVARQGHGVAVAVVPGPGGDLYQVRQETGLAVSTLLLSVAGTTPLVLRRRYPTTVFWLVLLATIEITDAPTVLFASSVIAAYSAVAYSPYRAPAIASLMIVALIVATRSGSAIPQIPNRLSPFVVLVPIAYAGNSIRRWRAQAASTLARMRALELGQQEATREAVESERARIARELHDVVTHNVSVMVVQAGAARKVMDRSPAQATQALLAVEASGRTAMVELRQVMGLLTSAAEEPQDACPDAPQPDLEQLETLVARVRATGVPVTLAFTGAPRALPPGVGLAAYRVVQEALTNTVKHAAGASAAVTVAYGEQELRVEIADTGGVPGESAATGNRRGLLGLRERLAVYGGTLHAAHRPTGGYRVSAVIPLEES
ncbi:hypothetical protein KGA66_08905 [Actinocrinis puniceicyclus]|uniref:histidine kinase n=1 Tax=Actinocrinis puniceicyclus TaxID=977794 RepID=A0A8J7WN23_9ACTN|nr:histidine kinase [Actinocrinis puniceicyclus]MBS2963162.1 hypothetical protein [Actinocrinis puniceicyclus]